MGALLVCLRGEQDQLDRDAVVLRVELLDRLRDVAREVLLLAHGDGALGVVHRVDVDDLRAARRPGRLAGSTAAAAAAIATGGDSQRAAAQQRDPGGSTLRGRRIARADVHPNSFLCL